jgi:hypothetical protein
MMTPILLALTLAVVQQPPLRAPGTDTAEAGRLRRRIEERFAARVQQELGLTADQATKLRATQERFGERRRTLIRQQMGRRMALQGQMRPGEAANADSVKRLMDGLQAGRGEMLKLDQDEDRDMAGYLTPVQRARYQMMRQRFQERVNEMREQRRGRMGDGGGRGRPGRRPPRGRPI